MAWHGIPKTFMSQKVHQKKAFTQFFFAGEIFKKYKCETSKVWLFISNYFELFLLALLVLSSQ